MFSLSSNADELLIHMCKLYAETGNEEIETLSISSYPHSDSYFRELESAGYIEFHNTVAPYVKLLDKAIDLSKRII